MEGFTGEIGMFQKTTETATFIKERIKRDPLIGMITGTGLANLTDTMEIDLDIPYEQIPHFPRSTVAGHAGILVSGSMAGKPILAMQGRFHIYEGYTVEEITFPVRVMATLGVKYLFIFSAAGGLNPDFVPGELMLLTDHINLTGSNPLIGGNLGEFGPRFPDMTSAYDKDLIALAREKAIEEGIALNQGVYVGITGPSLETPAETRFLRSIGADAVGMSTVNEVIVAVHSALKVLAIVAITNVNIPDSMTGTSIEEVITNARKASPCLARLFRKIIEDLER
ncbi:MAG: purine-nucleoside phosphorylase [Deltaproteobacteria bacterium]|nr:MAG: purine-nucleoside phosphorylase [Deltaproteobacteria bacterium]